MKFLKNLLFFCPVIKFPDHLELLQKRKQKKTSIFLYLKADKWLKMYTTSQRKLFLIY